LPTGCNRSGANLYARGQGADKFRGVYDNTEIFHKLAELTDVQ
jgi:alkaline phosphatase